eukprot:TRINITY_DN1174_c0_g1_i1.p2 TRINITY_DN1174_c0_g1~~TRINITY_DN1174_c0_g1_i1.p2  ORF type:complete len:134 (-),score=35.09 TRINITY_DN1174_c0_g1_i1:122-523(-)
MFYGSSRGVDPMAMMQMYQGMLGQSSPHGASPTLYVGNLPSNVTEREMSILFRLMPGYSGVRLITREGKPPICFADFTDAVRASYTMSLLQGFRLDDHSPPISIEFDKGSKPRDRDAPAERRSSRERERRDER